MSNEESTTLKNILSAGKAEFLEKDFNSASLRNIVKTAGVTTGAFYGYFSGKEALFAALVEEHAKAIMNIFMSAQEDFEKLPDEEKANHMGVESRTSLNENIPLTIIWQTAFSMFGTSLPCERKASMN